MEPFDVKKFLSTVSGKPGVYCMLGKEGKVLYVGKARNLRKRLPSYFRSPEQLSAKNRALTAEITAIDITVTHTENEALILENNLIKAHQPRYNILLRDDKSYPCIYLSDEEFPRLKLHRGAKRAKKGHYFGPYPSAGSVRDSLNLLQKLFAVRQCEDSFYQNRSRPCLQYQIKRCSAPCTGLISADAYREDVRCAEMFLQGKSHAVIEMLAGKMEAASKALQFEQAARYRDQISRLRHLQQRQYMDTDGCSDVDVVASILLEGAACVQVFTVRGGRHLGCRPWFPKQIQDADAQVILEAFLPQYYLNSKHDLPPEIVINCALEDTVPLAEAIARQRGHAVRIHSQVRGVRARWVEMAEENARTALAQRKPTQYRERLAALAYALKLEELPERIECFDISHTGGESTVASCVVFDPDGPRSGDYRRFNIKETTPGDDYAAMHQALTRRYTRVQKEDGRLPDILIIDGGKGQVKQARNMLEELQLNGVFLLGIAKGPDRRPGLETLILPDGHSPLILKKDSPALHLLQQVRDESHRFAITGHRQQRDKRRRTSTLEDIAGIGAKRRRNLISSFGGLHGVMQAGVEDLSQVPGIHKHLAQKIYDAFHDNS